MDKKVLSEKERLAARIAQLESRLSSMRRATRNNQGVRASKTTVQTYGDYVWKKDDVVDTVSFEIDYMQAESDYNAVLMGGDKSKYHSFKYVLSPEERRRPIDMRATSWDKNDGGQRVLNVYKKMFTNRKSGNVDPVSKKKWVEKVGVDSEKEISTFHDW